MKVVGNSTFDFAIIGSGVSGGRIAYELTRSGAKCLLIEAGREYSAATFPNEELDYSTQLFWGGGLEVSADGRLGFLRARCVGGTSIVNQALLDRFDDLAWSQWKNRSGVSFFTSDEMEKHYSACESEFPVSEIPEKFRNRNCHIFTQAFEKQGYHWAPLRRAQGDCKLGQGTDCIVCLGGCPRDSKQSALVTTIRKARAMGLQIESEFEVERIHYARDRIQIFGNKKGQPHEIEAPKVVLAAGALGNSGILLKSMKENSGMKRKLPAVGTGFCCHPQFMSYALFDDEPVNAHKGAFQAVEGHDRRFREAGWKFENVFAPPIGTAMLMPGYGRQHHELMSRYRFYASMEIAIRDEPTGRIRIGSDGRLKIEKAMTAQDRHVARGGLKLVNELFQAAGAKRVVNCEQGFGLHLMGGCPIGTDGKTSVVDPDFQVHEHPGLLIADSSVFPTAPGINPSFTVMALSHRAAQGWVRQ